MVCGTRVRRNDAAMENKMPDQKKLLHPEIERNSYNWFVVRFIEINIGQVTPDGIGIFSICTGRAFIKRNKSSSAFRRNFYHRIDGGTWQVAHKNIIVYNGAVAFWNP